MRSQKNQMRLVFWQRKRYDDSDRDPLKVTSERKSELEKSQNELKNNLEQNDKILRYLIVLTSIVAKIDKKIRIYALVVD